MFKTKRIKVIGNDIYLSKQSFFSRYLEKYTDTRQSESSGPIVLEEYLGVLHLHTPKPIIRVFEDNKLVKTYTIEPITANPDLTGQYFHISVRIFKHHGVMIEGSISKQVDSYPTWKEKDGESIRFQPFYLSTADPAFPEGLIGQGVFKRGLHFSGYISPTSIRAICVCDKCNQSFTLQHFHGGFSEAQYFYSEDSKQTLLVPYGQIENMPTHLQKDIDKQVIAEVEAMLPKPTKGKGRYRYYNSFCCPHCASPYIDFQKHKEIRPTEYYMLKHINEELQYFERESTT